jgi:serine phosphatase RsbU (regulator of sigma subunit)
VGGSLCFIAFATMLLPLLYAAAGFSTPFLVALGAIPLLVLNVLLPRWTRAEKLPGILFCLELQALIIIVSMDKGDIAFAATLWLALLPLLGSFVSGVRLAVVIVVGSLFFLWYRTAESADEHRFWVFLTIASMSAVTGFVAWLYESTRGRAEHEEALRHEAERERLKNELEIAARIQTSILPREEEIRGLQVATRMLPADEVGGDYYDVLPTRDGAWLAIGDVSGHGLNAGLISLMVQSMISILSRQLPDATPSGLLGPLNQALFENIRNRLKKDDYVTLSLMRYHDDGRFVFAGSHEDILIYRARERRCARLESHGAWLGAMRDIGRFTRDTRCQLEQGDTVLLVTDGLTEAMNAQGEQFGMERLAEELTRLGDLPVAEIRDRLLSRIRGWMEVQQDDIAIVVLRHARAAPRVAAA